MKLERNNNNNNSAALLVGASTALAGLVYYAIKEKSRRSRELQDADADPSITLECVTDFEEMIFTRGASPISTITWFTGDAVRAGATIQQRFNEIVKANPWIGGRVMRINGRTYLRYSSTSSSSNIQEQFHQLEPGKCPISRDTPFENLGKICADSGLLFEFKHNPKHPLFQVTVVPCSKTPTMYFGVVVSMAHGLGDGHTYYNLYNMLMGSEPVQALEASRIPSTEKQQEEAMGKQEFGIMMNPGYVISAVRGIVFQKLIAPFLGSRFQVTSRYIKVDTNKLQQLKKQAVANVDNVEFVSSNDVLTSWFMSNSDCQHGLMAINFRNRLEGHSDQHAGNYEYLLYYKVPDDASDPTLIRRSIPCMKRVVTTATWPSWWTLAKQDFCVISNWSSFIADTCVLDGCEEQVHLPLYDIASALPSTIAICLIFRAGPQKQLALLVAGTPSKLAGLENAPFEAKGQKLK